MLFVAFDQVERNEQSSFRSYFGKLTLSYRIIFFFSLVSLILNAFFSIGLTLANIPSRTFALKQLWRLFTAPYAFLDGLYGFFSLVISFWWLACLLPGYERKYSSIHLLIQIFMQSLIIQIVFSIIVSLLVQNSYFIETYNDFYFSIGWIPIVIIWMFKFTGQYKQQKINFCFLPFTLKNKYLVWVISIIMIALTIQRTPLIVATLLGAIQFHIFNRSLIRIPLCMLVVLQKPYKLCFSCFDSFISLDSVRHNLQRMYKIEQKQLLGQSTQQQQHWPQKYENQIDKKPIIELSSTQKQNQMAKNQLQKQQQN